MGRPEESRRPSRGAGASVALLACSSLLLIMGVAVVAERPLGSSGEARAVAVGRGWTAPETPEEPSVLAALAGSFLDAHRQVWPNMEMGWKLMLGSLIGLLGAALGSVGGVGGGGIFVPMFTLVLGFDPKSSAALSKCMIMGAAFSTVYYNFRMRHPAAKDQQLPVVDYDLALFFQPMMMLGISMGVAFNVIFPEWMVIVLLILLFLGC